jgi:hypothetical protein
VAHRGYPNAPLEGLPPRVVQLASNFCVRACFDLKPSIYTHVDLPRDAQMRISKIHNKRVSSLLPMEIRGGNRYGIASECLNPLQHVNHQHLHQHHLHPRHFHVLISWIVFPRSIVSLCLDLSSDLLMDMVKDYVYGCITFCYLLYMMVLCTDA